ncbi:hypothetical protein C8J57DRAFT_1466535 [Mycena rebaudengoi]|nr:hypothetical protein C8J57DRAFT_1466535 [Mycena rebaudengoi]
MPFTSSPSSSSSSTTEKSAATAPNDFLGAFGTLQSTFGFSGSAPTPVPDSSSVLSFRTELRSRLRSKIAGMKTALSPAAEPVKAAPVKKLLAVPPFPSQFTKL